MVLQMRHENKVAILLKVIIVRGQVMGLKEEVMQREW